MSKIYLGLVHYPVNNREGDIITSSITNLDIHDISRSAITFGVNKFFIIHPNERQKEIFTKIVSFWKTDLAKYYNKDRVEALTVIDFLPSIEDSIKKVKNQDGRDPIVITTTAAKMDGQLSFSQSKRLFKEERSILLLFGTGNGLTKEVHQKADFILEPIIGPTLYNHLSVRSAVAIVLDRLTSDKYKEE